MAQAATSRGEPPTAARPLRSCRSSRPLAQVYHVVKALDQVAQRQMTSDDLMRLFNVTLTPQEAQEEFAAYLANVDRPSDVIRTLQHSGSAGGYVPRPR